MSGVRPCCSHNMEFTDDVDLIAGECIHSKTYR